MTESLSMRLAKWLIEQEPGLLAADPYTCGKVCAALAANLGCNLATVIVHEGVEGYVRVVDQLSDVIHDNAMKTARNAAHLDAHGGPDVSSASH